MNFNASWLIVLHFCGLITIVDEKQITFVNVQNKKLIILTLKMKVAKLVGKHMETDAISLSNNVSRLIIRNARFLRNHHFREQTSRTRHFEEKTCLQIFFREIDFFEEIITLFFSKDLFLGAVILPWITTW